MKQWLTVILILFAGMLTSSVLSMPVFLMPAEVQTNDCTSLLKQAADFVNPDDPDAFEQFGYITAGSANRIRSQPSVSGNVLGQVPGLRFVEVLGEAECADGYLWREIAYHGVVGWTVETDGKERFLVPYFRPQPEIVGEHDEERGVIVVDTESAAFEIPYAFFENPENAEVTMVFHPGRMQPDTMVSHPAFVRYIIQEITENPDDPLAPWPTLLSVYRMEDQCTMKPCIPIVSDGVVEVDEDRLPFGAAGARRGLTAQAAPIDFINGYGTRSIAVFYNGDLYLGASSTFEYLYEAVTEDEVYGVSLMSPITVSDPSLIPGEGFDEFWNDVYNQIEPTISLSDLIDETEDNLDNASAADFTPDLDTFAALIASLEIRQPDFTASAIVEAD